MVTATQLSLGKQIISSDLAIQTLLKEASLVGGIYTMGFDECLIITNDIWKQGVGGVPLHCFLLATAMQPGQVPDIEDEEVILLRVTGPAALPAESELVEVRAEAMREIVTSRGLEAARNSEVILDVLTRNEIQFSAFKAKVIGTFYEDEVNGQPIITFGSDIETFYSASRYKVYKPHGSSLEAIACYPEKIFDEELERQKIAKENRLLLNEVPEPARVQIGRVRYTSTLRRRKRDATSNMKTDVPVRINVKDFIALKTAVFGMTRLGKSNTMKTIATAIFEHSKREKKKIGQLLFDPAGEYANVNQQDKTALAQLGTEHVTIFRFGAKEDEEGVRPLSVNFFSDGTIDVTKSIISSYLGVRNRDYTNAFIAADILGPDKFDDNPSAWKRARRCRAAFYATLLKAGLKPSKNLYVRFAANKTVVTMVNTELEKMYKDAPEETRILPVQSDDKGTLALNVQNLIPWFDALVVAKNAEGFPRDWVDANMEAILTVFTGSVGSGYKILSPLNVYHNQNAQEDYAKEVLDELINGKIVIIDLSLGTESVLKFSSERIINHIVEDAARRFTQNKSLHSIQIYIEEAHRLFNRDRMHQPEETDPYVRLAKEAAKFEIGLIYATQEVSSVDPLILSNTSNWIVAHLNNHSEVKELSKYYDFQDFSALTLKAEDVGFVRLKTKSGRYIIPTQIDLFDEEKIKTAQAVAKQKK